MNNIGSSSVLSLGPIDSLINEPIMSEHSFKHGKREIQYDLPDYRPNTSGKIVTESEDQFIGRKTILKKTISTMNQLDRTSQRRSFLVTGYRGSGKTLYVNKVVRDYRKKYEAKKNRQAAKDGCKYKLSEIVYLNLGNSKNLEINPILFDMVRQLSSRLSRTSLSIRFYTSIAWFFSLCSSLYVISWALNAWYPDAIADLKPSWLKFELVINGVSLFFLIISFVFLSIIASVKRARRIGRRRFLNSFFSKVKLIDSLNRLIEDIDYSVTDEMGIKHDFFSAGKKRLRREISERECESRLIDILDQCRYSKIRIIYIFDELDKISLSDKDQRELIELKDRKNQIDLVLSGLKNIISYGHAYFFFIAGREIFDTYHSEIGKTGNLYENLFDEIINVPSLLKDFSDQRNAYPDSMIEQYVVSKLAPELFSKREEDCTLANYIQNEFDSSIKRYSGKADQSGAVSSHDAVSDSGAELTEDDVRDAFFLRGFINYLTLRSWGNCKRLCQLFHQYVQSENGQMRLVFSIEDQQRILLGSFLYNSLYRSMSDKIIRGDDKLVVSTLLVFDHILKFHSTGFSRRHLERVATVLNIHSSPELTEVVDSIINNVLYPYVRRIRNGVHDLRFSSLLTHELKYSSYINPVESALFNFSLGANEDVKLFYQEQIKALGEEVSSSSGRMISAAKYHSILADLYRWERKFDKAVQHYDQSIEIYLRLYNENDKKSSDEANIELHSLMYSLLNAGNVYEISGAYSNAASYYHHALVVLSTFRNHRAFADRASPYLNSISQACMAMLYVKAKCIKNSADMSAIKISSLSSSALPYAHSLPILNIINDSRAFEVVLGKDTNVDSLEFVDSASPLSTEDPHLLSMLDQLCGVGVRCKTIVDESGNVISIKILGSSSLLNAADSSSLLAEVELNGDRSKIKIALGEDHVESFSLDGMTLLRIATLCFIDNNVSDADKILSGLIGALEQPGKPVADRHTHFLKAISSIRQQEMQLFMKVSGLFGEEATNNLESEKPLSEPEYWAEWCNKTQDVVKDFGSDQAGINTCFEEVITKVRLGSEELCTNNLKVRGVMKMISLLNIKIALSELIPVDFVRFTGGDGYAYLPESIQAQNFSDVGKSFLKDMVDEVCLIEGEVNYQPLINFIHRDLKIGIKKKTDKEDGSASESAFDELFDQLRKGDLVNLKEFTRWDNLLEKCANPRYASSIEVLSPLLTSQSPLSQLIWSYTRWALFPDSSNVPVFSDSSMFSVRSRLFELLLEAKQSYENIDVSLMSFESLSERLKLDHDLELLPEMEENSKKSIYESVYLHFRLIKAIERFVDNDSYIMCPPICYAYYGMWKILFRLVSHLALTDRECKGSIELAMAKASDMLCCEHETSARKSIDYRPLYDFSNIESMAISSLDALSMFRKPIGSAKRNVFSAKYLISDDYEDSLFLMEVYFYKLIALSADTHINFIKYCRFKLESKLQRQYPSTSSDPYFSPDHSRYSAHP